MGRWAEVRVEATQEAAEAVSALLIELGAGGVVRDDSDADAPVFVAYWPDDSRLEERLARLRERLAALPEHGLDPGPARVDVGWVAEEDWAHGWKAYFRPRPVGVRFMIRPTWDPERADARDDELTLLIDPGMAFGTGNHATTRLCIELLEKYVTPGAVVADVGTGSGILAIAAALLGASRVVGVDVDPAAVKIAEGNAAVNGVEDRVRFASGSAAQARAILGEPASIVVANITADVLRFLSADLVKLLAPGGRLIVSGVVTSKVAGVLEAFHALGLWKEMQRKEEDWAAITFRFGGEDLGADETPGRREADADAPSRSSTTDARGAGRGIG